MHTPGDIKTIRLPRCGVCQERWCVPLGCGLGVVSY